AHPHHRRQRSPRQLGRARSARPRPRDRQRRSAVARTARARHSAPRGRVGRPGADRRRAGRLRRRPALRRDPLPLELSRRGRLPQQRGGDLQRPASGDDGRDPPRDHRLQRLRLRDGLGATDLPPALRAARRGPPVPGARPLRPLEGGGRADGGDVCAPLRDDRPRLPLPLDRPPRRGAGARDESGAGRGEGGDQPLGLRGHPRRRASLPPRPGGGPQRFPPVQHHRRRHPPTRADRGAAARTAAHDRGARPAPRQRLALVDREGPPGAGLRPATLLARRV
ncbi:MAG: UDP-glucose 4-epimerase, partial [uncultured Thermomicrobiales bacterium]